MGGWVGLILVKFFCHFLLRPLSREKCFLCLDLFSWVWTLWQHGYEGQLTILSMCSSYVGGSNLSLVVEEKPPCKRGRKTCTCYWKNLLVRGGRKIVSCCWKNLLVGGGGKLFLCCWKNLLVGGGGKFVSCCWKNLLVGGGGKLVFVVEKTSL